MIKYVYTLRNRYRGYVTDLDDLAILGTATSYKTEAEAKQAIEKGWRYLCMAKENRVQAFVRRLLKW